MSKPLSYTDCAVIVFGWFFLSVEDCPNRPTGCGSEVIGPAFLIGGDILKGPDRHNSPGAYREEERQPRLKEY